jgi:hypothetical protein
MRLNAQQQVRSLLFIIAHASLPTHHNPAPACMFVHMRVLDVCLMLFFHDLSSMSLSNGPVTSLLDSVVM